MLWWVGLGLQSSIHTATHSLPHIPFFCSFVFHKNKKVNFLKYNISFTTKGSDVFCGRSFAEPLASNSGQHLATSHKGCDCSVPQQNLAICTQNSSSFLSFIVMKTFFLVKSDVMFQSKLDFFFYFFNRRKKQILISKIFFTGKRGIDLPAVFIILMIFY